MAEGRCSVKKGVRDLEEEITCAICHEHYTEPRVLPCGHYYCKRCLHQLTLRKGVGKPFSCPECRKGTTLPERGLDNLPTAFFVNRMKEIHSKLELACGKLSCERHEQPMDIYCYDCKSLACPYCTIKQHRDHNHEFVKVAAPEMKQKLLEQLNPLRESCSDMRSAMDNVQTTISELEDQGKSVTKRIENSFAELLSIVEHRKQELLAEAAARVDEKARHLSEQGEGLSIACATAESIIDYTERFVEHSANDDIMCMHTEIQSLINREIKNQQREGKYLKPVEEADLGVNINCAKDLKQLCQTQANIVRPATCAKSSVTGMATGAESSDDDYFSVNEDYRATMKEIKKELTILCSGPVGAGKSTLLNGLVGEKNTDPFHVGHSLKHSTTRVTPKQIEKNGVQLTLCNTPGLEGDKNDREYLREIKEKCSDFDLFVYCSKCTETRVTSLFDEESTLYKLTKLFGVKELWGKAIVILTHCNGLVDDFEEEAVYNPEINIEKELKIKVEQWKSRFHKEITKLGYQSAGHVPVLPAGFTAELPGYPSYVV
jgi:tRNA U34 5-carboxymethylaminomethyl modifying GTPase MnmE/TrmE